jgi:cytidine deaminase
VGVAILLDNEKIVLGSNQENAAYPSGFALNA